MLRLAAICLVAFGFIASVYSVVPVLLGPLGAELSFAIAFVVEFMALFSVAIGMVIYDTTKRRQILYVALGVLSLFVGDGMGLAAPAILPHLNPGWLWVLFSDVSWFGLLSRVVANCFFLASVFKANSSDNMSRNDQVWLAIPVIVVAIVLVLLSLSLVSPAFGLDVSHVFARMMMLPLLLSTVLSIIVLSGYLVQVMRRPTAFEILFSVFMLNAVYHHMAFLLFDAAGRALTVEFLMPSRLFSYGVVLVAMVAALRDLYRSASQSSSAKSAFLATMSHEIRTPLNGVLGMAQLLRQTSLNDVQRERVNAILSSGRALMSLLNDILDMSKIEAGHAEIETRPFRPYDITSDLSNAIVALTQEKNLKLVWDDKVLRNKIFIGDEVRFRQVLWNLLSNAVKFTRKGSVQLVVEHDSSRAGGRIPGSRNNEVYRFSVSDTGIGIAPERQARIFQAFTQGDNSTMRQFGGTGLGLSISQSLITMMGGYIGLHSIAGQGTRFDCWLPFDVRAIGHTARDRDGVNRKENASGVLMDKRVLVVEDNEINANVMQAFLERMGLKVDIVGNGRLAVRAFQTGNYDVILMDAHMPVLDGEGATRHIREIERGASGGRIPIIGVTADAFADRQRDFLAAGMDEVITKPVEERRLYASLIHHLRGHGELTQAMRPAFSEQDDTSQSDWTMAQGMANEPVQSKVAAADLSWRAFANADPVPGKYSLKPAGDVEATEIDNRHGGNTPQSDNGPEDSNLRRYNPSPFKSPIDTPSHETGDKEQGPVATQSATDEKNIRSDTGMADAEPETVGKLPAGITRRPLVRRLMRGGGLTRRFSSHQSDVNGNDPQVTRTGNLPPAQPRSGSDAVNKKAAKTPGESDAATLKAPEASGALVNTTRLREMQDALGTDQMTILIQMLPEAYGEERARMTNAITANDASGFRRAAHSLKGMAANLAADEISRRARELEYFEGNLKDSEEYIAQIDGIVQKTFQELLDKLSK
jgi:signal transduction histidine kinase/DNA-binding response OmpR family regulator/HPt (histidine-containing phosphotransfer) domain-containing protein